MSNKCFSIFAYLKKYPDSELNRTTYNNLSCPHCNHLNVKKITQRLYNNGAWQKKIRACNIVCKECNEIFRMKSFTLRGRE